MAATNVTNSIFFSTQGRLVTLEEVPTVLERAGKLVADLTSKIASHSFVTETVTSLDNGIELTCKVGEQEDALKQVKEEVDALVRVQAFITRLKMAHSLMKRTVEAIKTTSLSDFCQAQGLTLEEPTLLADYLHKKGVNRPEMPTYNYGELTEEEALDELDVKTRARLLTLDSTAAAIGSNIHPGGPFSTAREQLLQSATAPSELQSYGQVPVVFSAEPSVAFEKVNDVFFELQSQHRGLEAEANRIKQNLAQRIREDKLKRNADHKAALATYHDDLELFTQACFDYNTQVETPYIKRKAALTCELAEWRAKELEKLAPYGISIPEEMRATLAEINQY